MADDSDSDNKIVIEVDANTDPAQKKLDDLASKGSDSLDKLSKKSADINTDNANVAPEPKERHANATGNSEDSAPDSGAAALRKITDILRNGAVGAGAGAIAGAEEAGGAAGATGGAADGADALTSKLKTVGEAGEGSIKKIKGALTDAFTAVGQGDFFASFTHGAEGAEHAAEKVREGIHVLHPVLEEAGISMGNLGAFARLAGAGFGVLATAVGGTVIVALAKVAEQTERTAARLKSLTGTDTANTNLTSQAKELGARPAELAPLAEEEEKFVQSRRAVDDVKGGVSHAAGVIYTPSPEAEAGSRVNIVGGNRPNVPGQPPSSEDVNQFRQTLLQAARIDKTPADQARAGVLAFEKDTFKTGVVKPENLDQLNSVSSAIGRSIVEGLSGPSAKGGIGRSFQNLEEVKAAPEVTGGKLNIDQVIAAVNRASPDIKAKADALPIGITEALDHLKTAAESVAEAFAGDAGVAAAVEKFSKFLSGIAEKADQTLHPRDYEPGGPKFVGPVSPKEKEEYNKPDILDVGKALLTGESDERFKDSNAIGAAKGLYNFNPIAIAETPDEQAQAQVRGAVATTLKSAVNGAIKSLKNIEGASEPGALEKALSSGETTTPQTQTQTKQNPSELFDKASDGSLIRNNVATPQSPDASLSPRSETAPAPQPEQQTSNQDQGSVISEITAAINSLGPKQNLEQTGVPPTLGIRGEAQPQDGAAANQVAALGNAAAQAAAQLASVKAPEQPAAAAPPVAAAEGGHVRGPGTSTSDSIPAMLSDGEYVMRTEAVKRIGVENLDAANNGSAHLSAGGEVHHYADGGNVVGDAKKTIADLGTGHHQVTYNRDTGGANIDGVEYPPDSPLLQDPEIRRLLQESMKDDGSKSEKHHKSDFVGTFGGEAQNDEGPNDFRFVAAGGLIKRFRDGGLVGNSPSVFSHFNLGGLATRIARSTAPVIGYASGGVARSVPSSAPDSMEHWGTIDMRTDHGDYRAATERDTMRHLNANAQRAKRFSTGHKPNWYGAGR